MKRHVLPVINRDERREEVPGSVSRGAALYIPPRIGLTLVVLFAGAGFIDATIRAAVLLRGPKDVHVIPGSFPALSPVQERVLRALQVQAGPIPDTCHAFDSVSYGGAILLSGRHHFTDSAGECCQKCKEHHPCNVWVWCGDPSGECWTPDNHTHYAGECWLKVQEDWDGVPSPFASNLVKDFHVLHTKEYEEHNPYDPRAKHWISGTARLPHSVPYEDNPQGAAAAAATDGAAEQKQQQQMGDAQGEQQVPRQAGAGKGLDASKSDEKPPVAADGAAAKSPATAAGAA